MLYLDNASLGRVTNFEIISYLTIFVNQLNYSHVNDGAEVIVVAFVVEVPASASYASET